MALKYAFKFKLWPYIKARIAAFAMVPVDHGEGMQVLHYTNGRD
jgi:hypothetical protein